MEEAVTRKFIHEDSSSVRSLCGKYSHLSLQSLRALILIPFYGKICLLVGILLILLKKPNYAVLS